MKRILLFIALIVCCIKVNAQKISWVSGTKTAHWTLKKITGISQTGGTPDANITGDSTLQTVTGFGGCFNELGWQSLQLLNVTDRNSVLKELFSPGVGANFTICRMPVGANDFSAGWYSYDETPGDFNLEHFSIAHDLKTLVPFIKGAQKYNPALALWASPWSPPQWMKKNGLYAAAMVPTAEQLAKYAGAGVKLIGMDFSHVTNGVTPGKTGKEGTDLFIQEDSYYKTYAAYFGKFIDAYAREGIKIGMVMPQNEFNSAQVFPSCTWTAHGLSAFISYLGPQMQNRNVKVFFGTVERVNEKLVDTILNSPQSGKYISGAGFQWAGKGAIAGIHKRYPDLSLYQSEQECGDGQNDWKYCRYTWELMKHYFKSGANAYLYWNIALKEGGTSTWGWKQNSLVSVDTLKKTYSYNYEYYLLKQLSHFVKPGARRLETSGSFANLLAFKNPDNSIVVVVQNDSSESRKLTFRINKTELSPLLEADSFNTFVLEGK